MKKLFLILFGFCVFLSIESNAQVTAPTLGYDDTYSLYTGKSTDTIGTGDSIWYYDIRKKNDSRMLCYVDMLIDSTGGTGDTVTIYLQNKLFTDLSYTTVDSFIWNGVNTIATGKVISFTPSSTYTGTISITASNRDSLFSTLVFDTTKTFSHSDTVALWYATQNGTIKKSALTGTITETKATYLQAGEYWRVYVIGSNDGMKAAIRRLNFKFVKP